MGCPIPIDILFNPTTSIKILMELIESLKNTLQTQLHLPTKMECVFSIFQ